MEFFKDPITGEDYVKGELRANDIITTKVDYLGLIVGVKEIDDKYIYYEIENKLYSK